MIKISKDIKIKQWQVIDNRDTSVDVSPSVAIAKAIETGLITNIEPITIIGQGKEALVFYGLDEHHRWVAVKMYKLYKSVHRQKLLNTPFTHPYDVMKEFPNKEYSAIKSLEKNKIPAPKPYTLNEFGYSMSFIGDDLGPAPLLAHVNKRLIVDSSDLLEECIDILRDMFIKSKYVHGDFNEYNLLFHEEKVYVIDFLQSENFILTDNVRHGSNLISLSQAYLILKKDLKNILRYFERAYRLYVDYNEVLDYCLGNIKKDIKNVHEIKKETEIRDAI